MVLWVVAVLNSTLATMQELTASDEGLGAVRSGNYDLMTGRGILHCAAREGRLGFVETLIKAGAQIDAPDGHGLTALQVSLGITYVTLPLLTNTNNRLAIVLICAGNPHLGVATTPRAMRGRGHTPESWSL